MRPQRVMDAHSTDPSILQPYMPMVSVDMTQMGTTDTTMVCHGERTVGQVRAEVARLARMPPENIILMEMGDYVNQLPDWIEAPSYMMAMTHLTSTVCVRMATRPPFLLHVQRGCTYNDLLDSISAVVGIRTDLLCVRRDGER